MQMRVIKLPIAHYNLLEHVMDRHLKNGEKLETIGKGKKVTFFMSVNLQASPFVFFNLHIYI